MGKIDDDEPCGTDPLIQKYCALTKWRDRSALVRKSIHLSRENDAVFCLGLLALNDRSQFVRFQACRLLAYSLRQKAIPELQKREKVEKDREIAASAAAAVDAIRHQNHTYFYDREHLGKTTWNPTPRSRG